MASKKTFLLIGILWIVILIGFIAYKEFTLQTGEEVLLKLRPIDPRDLFRGDYVILSYEISQIDINSVPASTKDFAIDETVYLFLKVSDDKIASAGRISKEPFTGELFIKGRVTRVQDNLIFVEYGIESYFVPEGKGYELESQRGDNMLVKAAVDRFGKAAIKAILVDGKEFVFKKEQIQPK